METYIQVLKNNRLKVTPRRKAIIGVFMKHGVRMGPYELYEKLKRKLPKLGLPTVYRILEELKDAGILVQSLAEDRRLRYALCACPDEHHHHFTCRKCKKVEEVEFCNFNGLSSFIEKNLNAKVESHNLQIEGLCARCR
ncbi:MAG: transcriptional repressor [Candidatus Omnitrophica bacterium]|nr:transcriptional repressor [Candidatus Omnitrophota bacterium]MBU4479812.1 transcriptional repressor [Candidatus Omnitrophota bacterium]